MSEANQPVFYYELGSPGCYFAAERIMSTLPVVPEWEPVLGRELGLVEGEPDWEAIARLAAEQGVQPLRPPPTWPPETRLAMLAATYAKRVGRAVAFSLAAFRQEFAGGRDLGEEETVLIAAAACEMHPTALLKGVGLRSVGEAVEQTKGLDQDKIADYIRTHTFKTVVGDVAFGKKGEWAKARVLTIQFQNIVGTTIDDFRDGKGEVVLWPDEYKAGEAMLPYSSVKH